MLSHLCSWLSWAGAPAVGRAACAIHRRQMQPAPPLLWEKARDGSRRPSGYAADLSVLSDFTSQPLFFFSSQSEPQRTDLESIQATISVVNKQFGLVSMCPWRTRPDPKARFPKFYCKSCRDADFLRCSFVNASVANSSWLAQDLSARPGERLVKQPEITYSSVYLGVWVFSEQALRRPHQYLLLTSDSKLIYAGRQWAQFLLFMKIFACCQRGWHLCVLALPSTPRPGHGAH